MMMNIHSLKLDLTLIHLMLTNNHLAFDGDPTLSFQLSKHKIQFNDKF